MPINTTHEQYDKKTKIWEKCRDAIEGEEAVKLGKEKYLPKLSGQDGNEYDAYLMRASYFNASGRTHEAMVGTVFRIDPTIDPPFPTNKLRKISEQVVSEVCEVGRCGLLTDAPITGGDPYIALYKAEDITNWQTRLTDADEVLIRLVLREIVQEPDEDDPYSVEDKTQYRELYLDEYSFYAQQLWVENEKGEFVREGEPIYPTAAGAKLTTIPFVFISALSISPEVSDPPMLDLINVNLSHYRSSADLEHGRHFTALPTAWVAGFDTEKELVIGSATAWVTDNTSANAGFLEFTGQGLQALEKALEQKEAHMALLGTQLFTTGQAETATAAKIHRSQQTASLTSISGAASDGITLAYNYYMMFKRLAGTATFKLSTDFLPETLDSNMITALVSTFQQGGMSIETLLWNFKQGELLPPDVSPEDELVRILAGLQRLQQGGM